MDLQSKKIEGLKSGFLKSGLRALYRKQGVLSIQHFENRLLPGFGWLTHAELTLASPSLGLLRGGAWGAWELSSVGKALMEIEEHGLVRRLGLVSSVGVAGGWLKVEARRRSVQEFFERESFLWHFRKKIPFTKVPDKQCVQAVGCVSNEFSAYQLWSPQSLFTVLVAGHDHLEGSCLQVGIAARPSLEAAIKGAALELISSRARHRHEDCRPRNIFCIESLPYFHHRLSNDPRINEVFRILTSGESSPMRVKREIDSSGIDTTFYRGMNPYVTVAVTRSNCADFEDVGYGIPEQGWPRTLFHPLG